MDIISNVGRRGAFSIVESSLEEISKKNIKIVRGCFYDFTNGNPGSSSALGAVLLVNGLEKSDKAWTDLSNILQVETFWLYRFSIGWNNKIQLTLYRTKQNGDLEAFLDDVSGAAAKLSRKWCEL